MHTFMRGTILDRTGRRTEARETLDEALRGAIALDMPAMRGIVTCTSAQLAISEGDFGRAEALLADLPEEAWRGIPRAEAYLMGTKADLRAARGEPDLAEPFYRQALDALEPEAGYFIAEVRRHFARFLIDRGRGREAREHVEWLLTYYRDPVAKVRYEEAQALLAECEAIAG
jgi:hypothetical protein